MNEIHSISIKGIRAALAVLDEGTINGAAEALYTSQPALSRLIRVTEQHLCLILFQRSVTGTIPTPEAGPVFDRFRRIINQLKIASDEIATALEDSGETPALDRQISVRHLRLLTELSRHRTLTDTARAMDQSVTATSRTLKDVDRIIGDQLFQRRSGYLTPTETGLLMIRHAKVVIHELRYVRQDIGIWAGKLSGLITIGSTPLTRSYLIPQALRSLSNLHPGIRFFIVEGPYQSLLESLRVGDIDIIVGALRDPAPAATVQEFRLFSAGLSIIARHGHPLAERDAISVSDLLAYPWIVSPPGTPTRAKFEQIFRRSGYAPPVPTVECSSSVVARELLIKTNMLTILTFEQVQFEDHVGVLVRLPMALPETVRPVGYTVRSDTAVPAATKALIQELRRRTYNSEC